MQGKAEILSCFRIHNHIRPNKIDAVAVAFQKRFEMRTDKFTNRCAAPILLNEQIMRMRDALQALREAGGEIAHRACRAGCLRCH